MPTQRLSPRDQRASSSEFWAEERRDSRAARPLQIPDESRERPGRDGHAHVPTRGPTSPGPTALAGMARSQTDVSAMQPRETGPPVRGPRRARPRNAGRTEHARAGTGVPSARGHRTANSVVAQESEFLPVSLLQTVAFWFCTSCWKLCFVSGRKNINIEKLNE